MRKITRLAVVLVMASLFTVCTLAVAPGLNVLTGTTEVQTFDDMTTLPSTVKNAVLDDSPIAGESGKVLRHYMGESITSTYGTVGFYFSPALDRNRPYRISFKAYKWVSDSSVGVTNTQLWIMKNGTAGWQIAKEIGSFASGKTSWYEHEYTVSTFGSLTNTSTGTSDTTDINTIYFEWQYDSLSSYNTTEKIYFDDVSIIPAYKVTYLDEDGTTQLRTSYESLTGDSFVPVVSAADANSGIIGWSKANDGTVDESIVLGNTDLTLYAVYDDSLNFNLKADKTLLISAGDKANLSTNLWHRNGVDGITVSYSVKEGSSYVTLSDNGDGSASVASKAEGLAVITCTASTGETEDIYILSEYQTLDVEEAVQTVPEIAASNWLYDHSGATYNETEGAWEVTKRTDVVKSDDGAGNIVYYNNGFLNKTVNADTSTYKYVLFRLKADRTTNFQVAITVDDSWKYTYPSVQATNGEYVAVCANINALASGGTAGSLVIGVTNHNGTVYIKDITLSSIPTYEPEIPEVKAVKLIETVSTLSGDGASADVQAAAFSNKSSDVNVSWKSSSDCVTVKNNGYGYATLKAMSDGTATITAYISDDETVYESFDVEVSGQREKQAVYDIRIFFWGASTTKHPPSSSIGWYGDWGMAASAEENDYVHKLVSYLEEEFYPSKVTFEVYASSTFDQSLSTETSATKDWSTHEQYANIESIMKDLKPNIIVTAMTGNMGSSTPVDVAYNAYKQMYDMMYSYCPDAIVIAQHCGLSCVTRNDELIAQLDETYSNKVFYDYHVNPTMKLDPSNLATEYANIHSGVAAHWGDKGHDLVATTCFNYLKPEIPANIEPVYIYIPEEIEIVGAAAITEKGGSLRLTVNSTPNDASADVIWSVDNTDIASIGDSGLLTAINNGIVTVTATSSYNSSVKDTLTVNITGQSETYTLTYSAGTEDIVTGLPASDDYAGKNYTLSSAIPLRDTYTFVGWGLTADATETVTTIDVIENTTVYAIWKKTDGFEFEGTYDENAGFIYGFDIDGGFHANVKDSYLWSTCTAGAKVTFKTPVLDIENANFLSFGLICGYADESSTVNLTVKTSDGNTEFVYPLTSTKYTAYVADISNLTGTITGIEIYANTVTPDSSAFDVALDYIRFGSVRSIDKNDGEFVVTDGTIYVSGLGYDGYTEINITTDSSNADAVNVITLASGYSCELYGYSTIYANSVSENANVTVNTLLYNEGNFYGNSSTKVYTSTTDGFTENTSLTNSLTTYDAASMRVIAPQGMRVKASVNAGLYLEETVDEYGFVIAKESKINDGTINDLVLNENYITTKHVVYGAAFDRDKNIHKVFDKDDIIEYFTVVLINVPENESALTTNLTFRPYIKLSDGNTLYGAKVTRSILEVAKAIYSIGNLDSETKIFIENIFDICGYVPELDNEISIPVDSLYD